MEGGYRSMKILFINLQTYKALCRQIIELNNLKDIKLSDLIEWIQLQNTKCTHYILNILNKNCSQKWLRDYKSIKLKAKTYDTYETQINVHIIPKIENIELKGLKTFHRQQFFNKKFNAGKDLSPATLKKIYCIINSAMKQAQINGLITKNPTVGVELPRLEQKEIKAFTQEEQDKFFEAAKDYDLYNALLRRLELKTVTFIH